MSECKKGIWKKVIIGSAIAVILVALAFFAVTSVIKSKNEGRIVPVLMYHGIADDAGYDVWTVAASEFERQMRDLRDRGREPVLPDQLALAARGLFLLPEKPVIITMDDGFRNNVDVAEPIMAKYGMKGICYLILGHIEDSDATRTHYRNRDNLIWPEVCAAMGRDVLSFGIHSISHTQNLEVQTGEVSPARHVFKSKTGKKAQAYCYPNGQVNDKLLAAVKRHDRYKTAMICDDKVFVFTGDADLYRIPRVSIYGGTHNFSISEVMRDGDFLSAVISYDGNRLPVVAVLHDNVTGETYQPSCGKVRLGGKQSVLVGWSNLPESADLSNFEVVIEEQNGLFSYTNLVLEARNK